VAERAHRVERNGQLQAFSRGLSFDSVKRVRTVAVEFGVLEGEDFGCEGIVVCVLYLCERTLTEREKDDEVEMHLMETVLV
jgi:hypothetical protein